MRPSAFYIMRTNLEKEFRQIFRNPTILRMIIVMPIFQLILIPLAADYEIKNINITIVDQDHSSYSRQLLHKIDASKYFIVRTLMPDFEHALNNVEQNVSDLILTIPNHFEQQLIRENKATLQVSADGVNGTKAGLGSAYLSMIINDFNREIRESLVQLPRRSDFPQVEIYSSLWYNPFVRYPLFMVPGILALLVTMVGALMCSLNIVHEKEIGTMEQLNVTPMKKYQFILGKLIPFWILGLLTITLGLVAGFLVYHIVPIGSLWTIYLFSAVYLFAALGVGLLLSTLVDNQLQATLFSFFIMMFFVMMGGLYTPLESMPHWAQILADGNPVSYFIRVLRAIIIKGSTLGDLWKDMRAMIIIAIVLNSLAILNYRKRMG